MSSLKKLTLLNYFICLIGLVAEFIFAHDLKPLENSVLIFLIVWGSLPILTLLIFLLKTPRILYCMKMSLIQISAVVGVGMILKINSIYIHPDPRGAIALATIPIVQIIGALFIGLVIRINTQKYLRANASEEEYSESEDENLEN
jgi:cytochrome c oxidase subunit IV